MSLLDSYFTHTATLKNPASLNSGGERTFGTGTSIKGRFEPCSKLYRDTKTGEIVQSDGLFFCKNSLTIYIGSELTISSISYEVTEIEDLYEFQASHKELKLKRK